MVEVHRLYAPIRLPVPIGFLERYFTEGKKGNEAG